MRQFLLFSLFLCLALSAAAQRKITGSVADADQNPLVGVNILVKGTTNGTVTDANGNFELNTVADGSALIISYMGYQTQTLQLSAAASYKIVMLDGIEIAEINIIGSRNANRTKTDSPVPVDVLEMKDLKTLSGRVDINQLMQYAAPSFNATKQSGSDGADHIDPASLRGLGPDQTLVLINGKRRHQSSLVNIFGTRGRGNTGTDMNAIPVSAIKRIEILRDGAAAQYGSDAIAGVINIVLNDQTDQLSGSFSYGVYSTHVGGDYAQQIRDTQDGWEPTLFNINGKNRYDGKDTPFDGNTAKLELNYGAKIGDKGGFINIGSEFLNKDRTLRPSFDWRSGYGSAAVEQFQFMVNSVIPVGENSEFYFFGGRGNRNTDAYAYNRAADTDADGDDRTVNALYPNGFVPSITSTIIDNSVTGGFKFVNKQGWKTDFSQTYGQNNFHYYIKNTNNASLGVASPINFDAGGHALTMQVSNLDFSKYYDDILGGLNIGFGTEFRSENFKIYAGEEASYATYDVNGIPITNPALQQPYLNEFGQQAPGGAQGFPGYSPDNEVNQSRTNFGTYADLELNLNEKFLIGAALRLENYSDFGTTFNYKLSTRYSFSSDFSLRASTSSGFRAPSLAQIHYNLLFNNIVAGRSLRTLLASNTSTIAKKFGIQKLKQETAQNYSVGFTYNHSGFTATVDGYLIDVKDRIILTDVFDVSAMNIGAEAAQFFANGIDTRTTGLDVILNYKMTLPSVNRQSLSLGLAGNFNNTKIAKIKAGSLNEYTFFGPFSRAYLEAAAPDYKISAIVGYSYGKFSVQATWTQFSQIIIQDFQWVDSPATTQDEADALYAKATDVYKAAGTLDLSLNYEISKKLSFTLGANNLLNSYPTPQFDGWTDQGGFSDSVLMGSDGAYVFGKLNFQF